MFTLLKGDNYNLKYTEEQLTKMASPISKSEDEKCKNAIKMVRDAMKHLNYTDDGNDIYSLEENSYAYALKLREKSSNKKITILVQGSYANKTNIPSESDVDVAIILESTFITKYRDNVTDKNYGFTEGTFSVQTLKDEVEREEPSVIIAQRPCALLPNMRKKYSGRCHITDKCKKCKMCMKLGCPAISLDGDTVKIDTTQCNGCGLCTNVCPFGAIEKEEK